MTATVIWNPVNKVYNWINAPLPFRRQLMIPVSYHIFLQEAYKTGQKKSLPYTLPTADSAAIPVYNAEKSIVAKRSSTVSARRICVTVPSS